MWNYRFQISISSKVWFNRFFFCTVDEVEVDIFHRTEIQTCLRKFFCDKVRRDAKQCCKQYQIMLKGDYSFRIWCQQFQARRRKREVWTRTYRLRSITVLITGRAQARHNIGKSKMNQRKFVVVFCVLIFGRAQKAGFKSISRDATLYRFWVGISSTSSCSHYFPVHHLFFVKSSVRMAIRELLTSSQYLATVAKAHVAKEVFTYRWFNWMPSACSDTVARSWSSSFSSFFFPIWIFKVEFRFSFRCICDSDFLVWSSFLFSVQFSFSVHIIFLSYF